MHRPIPGIAAALLASAPVTAAADVGDHASHYEPPEATRRGDLTVGIHLGGALGNVAGFPNKVAKIDVPRFEADTGLGLGGAGSLWVGSAFRDWLVFGVGVFSAQVAGDEQTSSGASFVVHAEGYPLFYRGGWLEDLGLFAELGAGGRVLRDGDEQTGDAGFLSHAGGGVVFEPWRPGDHFSLGWMLGYTHQHSPSLTAHLGLTGLRAVYYGGP